MVGFNIDENVDIFCLETLAAQFKSWLHWHLTPILRAVPHKQIKPLYLSPSCLHFTLMTLHLHLSFVSLSPTVSLPWQPPGCIYMQILICGCGEKQKKNKKKKMGTKIKRFSLLSLNKECPAILLASSFSIRFGSPDWTWPPESDVCCLQSRVKGGQLQSAQSGSWRRRGKRLTLHWWFLAEKEVQGKINKHTRRSTGG